MMMSEVAASGWQFFRRAAVRFPLRLICLGSEGYALMTAPDERKRSHRFAFFGHEQWEEDRANAELTAWLLDNADALLAAAESVERVRELAAELDSRVEFEGGGDLRTNRWIVRRLRAALEGETAGEVGTE